MELAKYQRKNKVNFKHLINLESVIESDICEIISLAKELKEKRLVLEDHKTLNDKYILMITKPSIVGMDTAFQIAVKELGGMPIINSLSGELLETCLQDEAYIKTLAVYGLSAVAVSTSKISDSSALEKYINVPVINSNNENSPCTALAGIMTILETKKDIKNLKVVIVGDLNIEDYSIMTGLAKFGADITLLPTNNSTPSEHAIRYSSQFGEVKVEKDKKLALKNADFIYLLKNGENDNVYIDEDDLSLCPNAYVLGVMPCDKTLVSSSVIQGERSLVYKQAENLLHIGKAILSLLVCKNR